MSYHIFQKYYKCWCAGDVEEDPCSHGIQYQGGYEEDAVQKGENHSCHAGVPNAFEGSVWQGAVHLPIFGGPSEGVRQSRHDKMREMLRHSLHS